MYFPMTASLWRRLVKDAGHDAKKLCIVACALCQSSNIAKPFVALAGVPSRT